MKSQQFYWKTQELYDHQRLRIYIWPMCVRSNPPLNNFIKTHLYWLSDLWHYDDLLMGLLSRGRWWMMERDQCPGLQGWWGHAHQYDELHGSRQGSGWGHSSQHPIVNTIIISLKSWEMSQGYMQEAHDNCTYKYMYVYALYTYYLACML